MALGIAKDLEPDVTECQLEAGDRIILANESAFYGVKEAELSQWVNELAKRYD